MLVKSESNQWSERTAAKPTVNIKLQLTNRDKIENKWLIVVNRNSSKWFIMMVVDSTVSLIGYKNLGDNRDW